MWRLPTIKEFEELINKCKWSQCVQDGFVGRLVVGPNGKSIFLPANGECCRDTINAAGLNGLYWSSTLVGNYSCSNASICLSFSSDYVTSSNRDRKYCLNVRPVSDDKTVGVDLGLSVNWCEHNWRTSAFTDIRRGGYFTYDEAIKLFENQNNNKMENEPILELNGKRYQNKAGGTCFSCALYKICDDKSPISAICNTFATTSESNFVLMSDLVTDTSNKKEDDKLFEYKGKRYRAVQGECTNGCALYNKCNDSAEGNAIASACTCDTGEMWEEIPYHVTDVSNMVDHILNDGKMNRLRPNYYVINGIECKDVIGEFDYNIGAAIKYLWRHGRKTEEGMSDKDKAIEDLKKAVEHIQFEIQRLSK